MDVSRTRTRTLGDADLEPLGKAVEIVDAGTPAPEAPPRAAAPAVLRQGVMKWSAIGIPLRRAIAFGSGTLMA